MALCDSHENDSEEFLELQQEALFDRLDGVDLLQDRLELLLGAELAASTSKRSNKDVLHKQIEAFEKLSNHAVSRFSVEKSYKVLLRVAEPPFPSSPKRISPKSRADNAESNTVLSCNPNLLDSITKLRQCLMKLKRRSQKSTTDNLVINHIEVFLKDIQYMKNLKKYFDEKIYSVLYKFFYDPADLLEDEKIASNEDASEPFFLTETDDPQEAENDRIFPRKPRFRYGLDIDHLTDKEQLSYAVEELYSINTKWEGLINNEDIISIDLFDLDSEVEVKKFSLTEFFYSLLRLMPDLFVKCQKSVELAKLWYQQSVTIYKIGSPESPLNAPAPISNYKQKMQETAKQIEDRDREIRKQEHAINIHEGDLKFLESRESRVKHLCDTSEKLEKHRDQIGEKYRSLIKERQSLADLMENTVKGTKKYEDLCEKLRHMDLEVIDQYRELKVLEYSLDIKQSEFSVKLEVKPSFIIFSETSKINMEKAKNELQRILGEKRKLERRYLLMKTNQERMQEIINRVNRNMEYADRPRTNQTYTIRKATSDERNDVVTTALKPTAAYIFSNKNTQKNDRKSFERRNSPSSNAETARTVLTEIPLTDVDKTVVPIPEDVDTPRERLRSAQAIKARMRSPVTVMTKAIRPKPSVNQAIK